MRDAQDRGGALMRLDSVTLRFGRLAALSEVSFEIRAGEIFGVAGPNGAGKSTLLNVCTGALRPSAGTVWFGQQRISGMARHRCCHLGIARTFQIPQIFASMSVGENVRVGSEFGGRAEGAPDFAAVVQAVGLSAQLAEPAATADLLTRKRIMLAAALATGPRIVFMDEPLGGLNAEEIALFVDLIGRLHAELGLTFVIVEHKTRALCELSDRLLILNFGKVAKLDAPDAVVADRHIQEIYLGGRGGGGAHA